MRIYRMAVLSLALLTLTTVALSADDGMQENNASKPSAPVVTLIEPGEEPCVALRYAVEKDTTGEIEVHMSMRIGQTSGELTMQPVRSPTLRLTAETSVENIADNGDITYVLRYTKTEARNEPGVISMVQEQMTEMMRLFRGVTTRSVITKHGVPVRSDVNLPAGTPAMASAQLEGLAQSIMQFDAPLPMEPVGIGARWRVVTTLHQNGMVLQQTAMYTLTAKNGETIELDVDMVQDAPEQNIVSPMVPPGATILLKSFDGTSKGSLTVNLADIRPTRGSLKSSSVAAMSVMMNGQSQEMGQTMEVDARLSRVGSKQVSDQSDQSSREEPIRRSR